VRETARRQSRALRGGTRGLATRVARARVRVRARLLLARPAPDRCLVGVSPSGRARARRLDFAGQPLAKPIYGRPVNTAALLGKDAKNEGATFTAQMQPLIQPGEQVLHAMRSHYSG
jgi:hypothetical protein